jgi:hypothetical protein
MLHRFAGISKVDYEFMQRQLMNFPVNYLIVRDTDKNEITVTTLVGSSRYCVAKDGEVTDSVMCLSNCFVIIGITPKHRVLIDGKPLITIADAPNTP